MASFLHYLIWINKPLLLLEFQLVVEGREVLRLERTLYSFWMCLDSAIIRSETIR